MLGLINRALENFVKERHGLTTWRRVVATAGLRFDSFEPLLMYEATLTDAVIAAMCAELQRPRDAVLEDVGTVLVSHSSRNGLRRLLRFGGVSFVDFLHSLEELPDRARLALPNLSLPGLRLEDLGAGQFRLVARPPFLGAGFILMGVLRAMADDYGALVVLDMAVQTAEIEVISIHLLDEDHAEGQPFDLGLRAV